MDEKEKTKKKKVSKPLSEAEIKYIYRNEFYPVTSGKYFNTYDDDYEYKESDYEDKNN